MYLGLQRALEARVKDLLDLIELDPATYIDRLPGELSGGQKQRIGIDPRAGRRDRKLIICDEVTSAPDQIGAGRTSLKLGYADCSQEMASPYLITQ